MWNGGPTRASWVGFGPKGLRFAGRARAGQGEDGTITVYLTAARSADGVSGGQGPAMGPAGPLGRPNAQTQQGLYVRASTRASGCRGRVEEFRGVQRYCKGLGGGGNAKGRHDDGNSITKTPSFRKRRNVSDRDAKHVFNHLARKCIPRGGSRECGEERQGFTVSAWSPPKSRSLGRHGQRRCSGATRWPREKRGKAASRGRLGKFAF